MKTNFKQLKTARGVSLKLNLCGIVVCDYTSIYTNPMVVCIPQTCHVSTNGKKITTKQNKIFEAALLVQNASTASSTGEHL